MPILKCLKYSENQKDNEKEYNSEKKPNCKM